MIATPLAAAAVPQSPGDCSAAPADGGYCGDGGPAADARMSLPRDVATVPGGGELIADSGNFVIREIERGVISTVAGLGVPGVAPPLRPTPVDEVALDDPRGVAAVSRDCFVIADAGLDAVLSVCDGVVRTVLGPSQVDLPVDVVALGDGTVAVVDQGSGRVLRVALVDGSVPEVLARGLRDPVQATVGSGGGSPLQRGLYVSEASASPEQPAGGRETMGDVVRIVPGGALTVVAGPGAGSTAAGALRFDRIAGVALGPAGSLLVADTDAVRAVWPDGSVSLVAGEGVPKDAPAQIAQAAGIAYGDGVLLIADARVDRIWRVLLHVPFAYAMETVSASTYGSAVGRSRPRALGAAPTCVRGSASSHTVNLAYASDGRIVLRVADLGTVVAFVVRGHVKRGFKVKTRRQGTVDYTFKNLPPGRYRLLVWVTAAKKSGTHVRGCVRLGRVQL